MTRVRLGLAALLLALPSLVLAAADPFAEFRIPDHSWRTFSWDVRGSVQANDRSNPSSQSDGSRADARVATTHSWFRDSERIRVSHSVGASFDGLWSGSEGSGGYHYSGFVGEEFWVSRSRQLEELAREAAFASTEWSVRSASATWELRLAGRIDGSWQRSLTSRDLHESRGDPWGRSDEQDGVGAVRRADQYAASVDLGVARGRVRDASGVYLASLLTDRLRSDGRIEQELSPLAARRLAELFYASGGFGAAHGLPDKFFWREVERVLRDDGAIGESGFDAYDLLHGLDPIVVAAGRFSRPSGWQAGPLIRYRHTHALSRSTSWNRTRVTVNDSVAFQWSYPGSSRGSTGQDDVYAGARAEWHRPYGTRTQVDVISEAVFGVGSPDERTVVSSQASIGHLVDERWFLRASAQQIRHFDEELGGTRYWNTNAELSAQYFLEDRWSLSLALTQSQARIWQSGRPFERSTRLSLGVGFNRGAFDAPGLIDPVRPLN